MPVDQVIQQSEKMIPRFSKLLLFILALGMFAGCATATKTAELAAERARKLVSATPCVGIDWFEIGRRDGALGKPASALQQHYRECENGVLPDPELYDSGRNAGLVDFCTAQSGFEIGRSGTPYMAVCPEHLERKFLPSYEQGKRVHLQEQESDSVSQRL